MDSQSQADELRKITALIKTRNYNDAERMLSGIADQTRFDVASARAHCALSQGDRVSALGALKDLFEPRNSETSKSVSGCEPERAWYYFLNLDRGNAAKADRIWSDLFKETLPNPTGKGNIDLSNCSTNRIAAVYMYMCSFEIGQSNYFRAKRYLSVARKLDPKVVVHPGIEKAFRLVRTDALSDIHTEKRIGRFLALPDYEGLSQFLSSARRERN